MADLMGALVVRHAEVRLRDERRRRRAGHDRARLRPHRRRDPGGVRRGRRHTLMGAAVRHRVRRRGEGVRVIDGTPPGYVTIGGSYADIGPSFSHYDGLLVAAITGSYDSFSTALNSVAVAGQGSSGLIAGAIDRHAQRRVRQHGAHRDRRRRLDGRRGDGLHREVPGAAPLRRRLTVHRHVGGHRRARGAARVYTTAYESILDIGNKTLSALEAADGRGGADGSFALTVLARSALWRSLWPRPGRARSSLPSPPVRPRWAPPPRPSTSARVTPGRS